MRSRLPVSRAFAAPLLAALALATGGPAAAGLQVPPVTALPATPSAPWLWYDGSSQAAVTALLARVTHPRTSGYLASVKSWVNGRLGSVTGGEDDTRARLGKGAALLYVLGQAPPANSGWASYRDVAAAAVRAIGTRQAVDTIGELVAPPADAINVLQDSSRLQSMAEAYDLLRGSGLSAEADTGMRAIIATWADALAADWNLAGALGVAGHRDNWGVKGGAALMTAALALPDHARADKWRDAAMTYVNESLDAVASTTGWYGESVWYLNYSLANLWSAAWQVKRTTGLDWPAALRPFVEASLAWRQPDGRAPPFEEGIANTFPWDVMAAGYPDLAPQMLWAWDHSPKNDENYENQQYHDVTRFLVADLDSVAAAPTGPATRFLGDTCNLAALRTGWGSDALQVTMMTARDYSTSELNTSRHNMRNPLDVVLHGGGALVLPTASGGPTVTTSPDRATFLAVGAKNIPLITKGAPFVASGSTLTFGDRLDSEDAGGRPNHYVDLARTTLTGVYALGTTVSRTVALVDLGYVVVLDRFRLDFQREIDLSWRGRGARTARSNTASLQSHSWAGVSNTGSAAPRLDLDVVGTSALSTESNASAYADSWNHEEAIAGVFVGASAKDAAFVSVFQVGGGEARAVASVGGASVAAAQVTRGATVDTILQNVGDGSVTAGGVTTDGSAALVRTIDGALAAFAVVQGKTLELGGTRRLSASVAVTLALTPSASGFVAELSSDTTGSVNLELDGIPGVVAGEVYQASLEGVSLGNVTPSGTKLTLSGLGKGTLVVEPAVCKRGAGEDPDGDRYCGSGDVCPSVVDDQQDGDGDGVGDACECLDVGTRCDDRSACSIDGCVPTTGACTHVAAGGDPTCDDGSACTTGDHCAGVACVGTALACEDGKACTSDGCDPSAGCVFAPRTGAACDDGDACTTGEACSAGGACAGGGAVACDDGDPCTTDACVSPGGCAASPTTGVACDDHDRCTIEDACVDGVCAGGSALGCDDGNPCTIDACDAQQGCQHAAQADTVACDDGSACTSGDHCASGECRGDGLDCDDGDPCTVDGCVVGVGCSHAAAEAGAPCDDHDACTDGDECGADGCRGAAATCDDGDPCTDDFCDGALGCQASPVDTPECAGTTEPQPEQVEAQPESVEPEPEPQPESVEPEPEPEPEPQPEQVEPEPDAGAETIEGPDGGGSDGGGDDLLAFPDGGSQTIVGGHDDGCAGGGADLGAPIALAVLLLATRSPRPRRRSRV